jgi:hypothetical protein
MSVVDRTLYRRRVLGATAVSAVALALALVVGLPVGSAAGASSGIKTFLVRSGEMPGFVVEGPPQFVTGASRWVTAVERETGSRARRDVRTLRAAGFRAGVYENLRPKSGGSDKAAGASVLQFNTPTEARRFVTPEYSEGLTLQPRGATIHPLKVAIAGARGFTVPGSGATPAAASNAYFSAGRCVFVVGDFIDGRHPNTGGPVVAAARSIDRRVGDACA